MAVGIRLGAASDTERSARDRLEELRNELAGEIDRDAAHAALPPDERGEDLTPSQHPADIASDLVQHELLLAQASTGRAHLAGVEDALARLAAGTYGLCVDCGQRIARERLAALPQAARCISCQQAEESRHHTRRPRR